MIFGVHAKSLLPSTICCLRSPYGFLRTLTLCAPQIQAPCLKVHDSKGTVLASFVICFRDIHDHRRANWTRLNCSITILSRIDENQKKSKRLRRSRGWDPGAQGFTTLELPSSRQAQLKNLDKAAKVMATTSRNAVSSLFDS